MTKRTLAVATLAALPFAAGALRADSIHSTDLAEARSVAGPDARPQWSFFTGEDFLLVPQMIGCPGAGWRCVVYTL